MSAISPARMCEGSGLAVGERRQRGELRKKVQCPHCLRMLPANYNGKLLGHARTAWRVK